MAGIRGPGALQIMGERTSGQDVRTANVMAVAAVANIVKSSLGPVGLDKVLLSAKRKVADSCVRAWTHALYSNQDTS